MKKVPTQQMAGNIVDVLLKEGLISKSQLDEALRMQSETDQPLVRILVDMGTITESAKMSILKKTYGYELVSLMTEELDPKVMSIIPRSIALRHHVVPVRIEDKTLVLAMEDPSNLLLIDNLKALVGLNIKPVIASCNDIDEALKKFPTTTEVAPHRIKVHFLIKILKGLFLPVLALAPIPVFVLILKMSESLQMQLAPMNTFDFVLYFILGLGLWALIIWEINGLLFKTSKGT